MMTVTIHGMTLMVWSGGNNLKSQNKLENSNKVMHYPAACGKTKIKKIVVQVGRAGILTPMAELEPINVEGVLVRRANLYNENEIKRKDIREGDSVIVERAGDVIPHIVEVDKSTRPKNLPRFKFPDTCPECGSEIDETEKEGVFKCAGEGFCGAQAIKKLKYFASCFDITDFDNKQIELFYDLVLIRKGIDIFALEEKLENFGLGKEWGAVADLLDSINNSRAVPLSKFICSLEIDHIGPGMAKLLANHYKSYENWYEAMVGLPSKAEC
ncbi:MAG: hypothetical protein QWI36_03045 [Wolbachia endosymbiont of Tyrophagus putrescentiae]|nr:hypothetical protein [Wolbachia endosymbiont of Tyrophagus putrescentiae]